MDRGNCEKRLRAIPRKIDHHRLFYCLLPSVGYEYQNECCNFVMHHDGDGGVSEEEFRMH